MTRDEIENRRAFLRGITRPDDWVDALCDMALDSLQYVPDERTLLREIVAAWDAHLEIEMQLEADKGKLDEANVAFERMRFAIVAAEKLCGISPQSK